jgi:Na+-driven multidrug efflux pump
VLLVGLQWFGSRYGIVGVAAAASIAVVVDVILLLVWSRRHVDFSILSGAGPPATACLLGVGAALASAPMVSAELGRGVLKGLAFSLVFAVLAALVWRRQLRRLLTGMEMLDSWSPDDPGPL